jgi:hypothetical protein
MTITSREKVQRVAIRLVLVIVAYLLATRLLTPGFIKLGVPLHSDDWAYFNYSRIGFRLHDLLKPRPLMLLAIKLLGVILNVKGFVVALLITAISLPVFILCVAEVVTGRLVGYVSTFIYFFLCFSLSTFYELNCLDFGGVLAGITACFYVLALTRIPPLDASAYQRISSVLWPAVLVWVSVEFKPTYCAVLVVLPFIFIRKAGLRLAIVRAIFAGLVVVAILLKDIALGSRFIALGAPASNPYAIAHSNAAVFHAFGYYIAWLFPLGVWPLVALAFLRLSLQQGWTIVVGVLTLALLTIVPMLAIPQHLVPMYSWFGSSIILLAVAFSFTQSAEVKLASIAWTMLLFAALVASAWAIAHDAPDYRTWYINNQRANAQTLRALKLLPTVLHPGERVLVAGPLNAFNPFKNDRFIASRFPYKFDWRVATPQRDLPLIPISRQASRLVPANNIELKDFDVVIYFDKTGRFIRSGSTDELNRLDSSHRLAAMFCNSWVAIPDAQTIGCLSELKEDQAILSLASLGPIPQSDAWTWFELGRAHEDLGQRAAAHEDYVKASALYSLDIFTDAVRRTALSSDNPIPK